MGPSNNHKKKVVVCGTFDVLHQGHKRFLSEASKLGILSIIVVPDDVVWENKRCEPVYNQEQRRINLLAQYKNVYIDCFDYGMKSLDKIGPDIFCLGYDQFVLSKRKIKQSLQCKKLNVKILRLDRYADGVHSSHYSGQMNKDELVVLQPQLCELA